MGWAVALHGGAGDIATDLSPPRKHAAEASLRRCLDLAIAALSNSTHSALDVVELVVRELENDPNFNSGRGSVLTTAGTVEMDACIMDGATRRCGSVSGLSTVVNPISLARLVMEKTPHVYLVFDGAEQFARDQGVETKDPSYFITEENVQQLEQVKKEKLGKSEGQVPPPMKNETIHANGYVGKESISSNGNCNYKGETVGCVAVDSCGNCAAATSTGGIVNKMVGRIGDSPLVGAGTYATNLCAVSATGRGEYIIRAAVAFQVDALMEHKGLSLTDAANEVINNRLENDKGGIIAVSAAGDIAMPFNTSGMFRACANEHGYSEIAIWH